MTKEQLNIELNKAESEYQKVKHDIYMEYALSNNPYEIGDIITDHIGTIRIEDIDVYLGISNYPQCVYKGKELNDNGEVKKKQKHITIYQKNIIKHITDGK